MLENEINEYKKFALSKNMFQVAIGLLLATSFQKTVTAVSEYFLMPIVNYFLGKTNGNWREWVISPILGMNIEIGKLAGVLLDFFVLSFILYLFYSRILKKFWPEIEGPIPPVSKIKNDEEIKQLFIPPFLKDK